MCNIAAYVGNRRAAPVLIEMIKRQEYFDGGYSTGIATISDGKLHWRKVLGNIDVLLSETDAIDLPGTVGFIHSRPANNFLSYAHPHLSSDEKIAVVENGICFDDANTPARNKAAQTLEDDGIEFLTKRHAEYDSFPQLKSGEYVSEAECLALLTEYYFKKCGNLTEAYSLANKDMYCDTASLMISEYEPDTIKAVRVTRPMNLLMADGESYLATTEFAFPNDICGERISLPLHHVCNIKSNSFEITGFKAVGSPVVGHLDINMYCLAYERIYNLLKGRKNNPADYDEIEVAIWLKTPELWKNCESNNYSEFARLTYEVLYELWTKGILKMEIRPQENSWGVRNCAFMWIE